MAEAGRVTGHIKMWDAKRGFGFIGTDAGGEDVFVHVSQVVGGFEPLKGDKIEFTKDVGKNGRPCARRIVIKNGG